MLSLILFLIFVAVIKYALDYFQLRTFPILPKNGSILITGCSPPKTVSIGHSTAIALSLQGYQVFAGVLNEEEAQKLKQNYPSLIPVILDVTKENDIENAFRFISQQTENRPLVALMNNAGIAIAEIVEYSNIQMYKNTMDVNAIGHVAVTLKFLPLILKSKGRIVNIISVAGLICTAKMTQYAMSKFAMEAFTDGLRREHVDTGISVSAIEPTFIKTDMVKNIKISNYPPDAKSKYSHFAITEEEQRLMAQTLYNDALDVSVVVEAVLHAINSPTPKTRYIVAAKRFLIVLLLARFLPDRILDKLTSTALNVIKKRNTTNKN